MPITCTSLLCLLRECKNFRFLLQIHGSLIVSGLKPHNQLVNAHNHSELCLTLTSGLIDMYCKCGDLYAAECDFEVVLSKDDSSWGTMMAAYAHSYTTMHRYQR